MPIYTYKCPECQSERDDFNRIDDRHTNAPTCECGARMAMQISPVRGVVQKDANYVCPATGEQVTSYRQRRNLFAKHNLMDARDFDKSHREKRSQAKRLRLQKALEICPQTFTEGGKTITAEDILNQNKTPLEAA